MEPKDNEAAMRAGIGDMLLAGGMYAYGIFPPHEAPTILQMLYYKQYIRAAKGGYAVTPAGLEFFST